MFTRWSWRTWVTSVSSWPGLTRFALKITKLHNTHYITVIPKHLKQTTVCFNNQLRLLADPLTCGPTTPGGPGGPFLPWKPWWKRQETRVGLSSVKIWNRVSGMHRTHYLRTAHRCFTRFSTVCLSACTLTSVISHQPAAAMAAS